MPHDIVTLFLALLAVGLVVGLVSLGLMAATGRATAVVAAVRASAVELAAAVAVTATLGSLYLSEVAGYEPCRLCWVQRGFMYPAAALLVAAVVTGRRTPTLVAGGLAAIGLPIALFHRYEQAVDNSTFCDIAAPCSARWVEHLGFITIPTMAAAGFAGLVALIALSPVWRQT